MKKKKEQTDMTCIKCLWNCRSYSKNGSLATVLANGDRRPLTLASSVLNRATPLEMSLRIPRRKQR